MRQVAVLGRKVGRMSSAKEVVCAQCGDFLGKETGWIDGYGRVCGNCLHAFMLEAQETKKQDGIAALRAALDTERQRAEQAEAEAGALRSALDSVYPLVAGRVLQLKDAGEVMAMEQWNAECIKIIQALSSKGGRP